LSGSQGFAGTVAGLVARAHVGDPKWTGPSQSAFRSIALPKFAFQPADVWRPLFDQSGWLLIRIMARCSNRIRMLGMLGVPTMESIMDKRSSVNAVYAESLVFESNVRPAAVPATDPVNEVIKRAQWIPAWSAAALVYESVATSQTPPSPVVH
jgi:hypothetical protein